MSILAIGLFGDWHVGGVDSRDGCGFVRYVFGVDSWIGRRRVVDFSGRLGRFDWRVVFWRCGIMIGWSGLDGVFGAV